MGSGLLRQSCWGRNSSYWRVIAGGRRAGVAEGELHVGWPFFFERKHRQSPSLANQDGGGFPYRPDRPEHGERGGPHGGSQVRKGTCGAGFGTVGESYVPFVNAWVRTDQPISLLIALLTRLQRSGCSRQACGTGDPRGAVVAWPAGLLLAVLALLHLV